MTSRSSFGSLGTSRSLSSSSRAPRARQLRRSRLQLGPVVAGRPRPPSRGRPRGRPAPPPARGRCDDSASSACCLASEVYRAPSEVTSGSASWVSRSRKRPRAGRAGRTAGQRSSVAVPRRVGGGSPRASVTGTRQVERDGRRRPREVLGRHDRLEGADRDLDLVGRRLLGRDQLQPQAGLHQRRGRTGCRRRPRRAAAPRRRGRRSRAAARCAGHVVADRDPEAALRRRDERPGDACRRPAPAA
jgi:hypothetical protein